MSCIMNQHPGTLLRSNISQQRTLKYLHLNSSCSSLTDRGENADDSRKIERNPEAALRNLNAALRRANAAAPKSVMFLPCLQFS